MKIVASDITEVPFPEMQQVHLEEVEMLNAIFACMEGVKNGSIGEDELTLQLAALLDHVQAHFANEERLMQLHMFPAYTMHKGAHERFLAELGQAIDNWKQGYQISQLEHFLSTRLIQWLKEHIGTMDFVTASFLAMQAPSD